MIDGQTVLLSKIVLTVAALSLVAYEEWRLHRDRPIERRVRTPIAAALALLALAAYCNFGQFRGQNAIHTWDTFHYYIGSKYFRELSYSRIYECAAVAKAEGGSLPEPWLIRDLTTGNVVATGAIAEPDQCKRHFTAKRWTEFKNDVGYFSGRVSATRWAGMNQDHGYNATPVWTMAGSLLANLAPASDRSVGLLVALDALLLAATLGALAWAFGARVVTLAAFYFGVNDPSALEWTWGAFLRNDWLAWLVLAICLMRKGRPAWAGACLAYASLLRLFPALLFLGPAAQAAVAFWRTRSVTLDLRRFFLGAAAAAVILLALSVTLTAPDAYPRFVEHMLRFEDTPLTNHMGLRTVLSSWPSGRVEEIKKLDVKDPWPVWKEGRRAHFRTLLPVYLAIVAAFAVVYLRVVVRAAPWQAMALGLAWVPILVQLTCYYYSFAAAIAALTVDRRGRSVDLLLLVMALGGQIAAACLFWWDDIYTAASVAAVLCALLLPIAWIHANRRKPPMEKSCSNVGGLPPRSVVLSKIIATASIVFVLFPTVGAAQPLSQTVRVDAGISVSYPEGWSIARPTMNSWVILNVPANQQETARPNVRVLIGFSERTDHADAMNQLADIAKESDTPSTFLTIAGWPALQRVQVVQRPQPSQRAPFPDAEMVQITTAVAAGNLLVRLEGNLPSDADQVLKDLVLAIGRSLAFAASGDRAPASVRVNAPLSVPAVSTAAIVSGFAEIASEAAGLSGGAGPPIFPATQLANGTNGELEVAVSNNGTNIVVVKQSGFITSNNGGRTFPFSGSLPVSDGDSSIAFGQSGNFYHAALSCFGNTCAAVCPANSNCIEVAASTNNGQSFGALVNAVVCPNSGGGACNSDQEHIAADRVNAGAGGADRVYMAFRDLSGSANVTCSPDSGATWAPRLALEGGADFPRVGMGTDGSFYVVFRNGGNIRIDKFNACTTSAAQMTRAAGGFPRTVSAFTNFAGCQVANGFGGLDRCNNGNILSGPTVTGDDTSANHVYVAWANNTAANNESILVADSTDGGVNWRPPVTVNANVTARRYHAWVCATGGNAFVTWYDRRAATAAQNDLTDYFAASAGLSGGNLVANNDEFKISTTSDPQCNLWPLGVRSMFDSENCSVQPQLAGFCKLTPIPNPDTSSNTRCDFAGPDATTCPANPAGPETCQLGNFGQAVKYGDYNGNACVLGRLYTVFASGAGLTSVRNFFQSFVVSSTPTTITYTGATTADFHDPATLSATLVLSGTSAPVAGQTITFTIGAQSCSGVTLATGSASCTLTLNQVPGSYTVTATFATSGLFQGSSASTAFTITREETTLSYTGDVIIANNTTAHLSGVLLEDGLVPIAGRMILFTLGTNGTAQTCSGITNAAGVATCTIFVVNQPFGAGVVAANFAGDAFYLPSSASANTIIFAFLTEGAFVLGNQTAQVGPDTDEFWGHDWSQRNVLSGGAAPNSFKGFASTISTNPPACGDTWSTRPGNSSAPPDTLPPYMGVVVSSVITTAGSKISGDVVEIVVVKTNPGYAPNPGHLGTGIVVAVFCK